MTPNCLNGLRHASQFPELELSDIQKEEMLRYEAMLDTKDFIAMKDTMANTTTNYAC